jgi:hypothetical protein
MGSSMRERSSLAFLHDDAVDEKIHFRKLCKTPVNGVPAQKRGIWLFSFSRLGCLPQKNKRDKGLFFGGILVRPGFESDLPRFFGKNR